MSWTLAPAVRRTGALLFDGARGGYFALNATATRALEVLLTGGTCEQAAHELATTYGVGAERAGADVAALVADLTGRDLLRQAA
ncbi:PqqD family peptide modification chaperone [Nonomuraea sp. NPDC050783]|uniref:PqqD family peptide modification chaperone n=1 Tax=Nonomuraea sp. NPDC050783 TaxID=3154634 RepID=UPI00346517A1